MSTIIYTRYFDPIPCKGVGQYSGSMKPQSGFVATGIEVEVKVESGGVLGVAWIGTKHGNQIRGIFHSHDPALSEERANGIFSAKAAARAVPR